MATKKAKVIKATKPAKASKAAKNEMPPPKMPPPHRSSSAAPSVVIHRTTAEISVSEQHSFELARTVMTATISTIVSLRDIFPRHRFAIRTYDCADPEITYDVFMNGSSGKFAFERSEDTLNWKVLSRGTDDRAVNKLLDWIEIAATDALEKKYLAKLQLSFHSIDGAQVSDANLLEAYNICFTYESGQMYVGTAVGKTGVANSVALRGAKKDLYTLVNDVAIMIQERDPLPDDRRMNMMLLYNDTCPHDYEPPGFHANTDPKRLIADDKGAKIGSMNTGFHGISVNLYQQGQQNGQNDQLGSKRRRFRLRSPSMSSEIDGGMTQEHGLILFQGMGKYRDPRTQDTQPVDGTKTQTSAEDGAPLASEETTPAFLPYSQTIIKRIDQIRGQKGVLRQEEYDMDEANSSDRRVACECGALADRMEGDLIQCDLCDSFKHIQCYGHLGPVPPAAKFACYSCLLDIEGVLLSQMKAICVERRTLYYLREHGGLHSTEGLAQYLDRDEDMTKDILSHLQGKGYIKRAMGYEKIRKGKGISAEPLFTLVADDQMLLSNIFRPELDIPHKLLLPDPTSPGSATASENRNEDSEQDLTMNIVNFDPKSGRDHVNENSVQATLAEASSTEGTPSPRSAIARHFSEHQNQQRAGNVRPSSFSGSLGGSYLSRKRPYDSTPEPKLAQSALRQQGTFGAGLEQDMLNRTKISAVNSPWTFRTTGN